VAARPADPDRARRGPAAATIGTSVAGAPSTDTVAFTSSRATSAGQKPKASCTSGRPPKMPSRAAPAGEAEQMVGEPFQLGAVAVDDADAEDHFVGLAIGRGGAAPAGVVADEVGAAIGEVGADAMPHHLGQALALGDHVGTREQHRADRTPAVAIHHRHLQRRRRRQAARAADAHAVGRVLRQLEAGEVDRHVGRLVSARIADLVEQLLGDRARR
jgi:hypothetical protein